MKLINEHKNNFITRLIERVIEIYNPKTKEQLFSFVFGYSRDFGLPKDCSKEIATFAVKNSEGA